MEKIIADLSKHMLTNEITRKSISPKTHFQRILIEDSLKKSKNDIINKEFHINEEKHTNKEIHTNEEKDINEEKHTNKEIYTKQKEIVAFEPKEKDTLFWSFYIASYGEVAYELLDNKNIISEKKIKYELIDKLRKNKQLVRQYKFATLSHIENQLANENKIDLKTFLSLSVIENINILYLKNKTCYQNFMNDTTDLHVFRHLENNRFSYFKSTKDEMKETVDALYLMDNIEKPLKSISAYKVDELIQISNKLGINIMSINSKKVKTKNELYESIVLYL
jgi:hypothetical protein